MTSRPNLALIGPPGSGRDTIADILVDRFDYEQHAFAESIRGFAEQVDLGYLDAIKYWGCYEAAKSHEPWVTERLNAISRAVKEWIHPDAWVYSLLDRLPSGAIVVSDVRYDNELRALADEGFEFALVSRPGYEYPGTAQPPAAPLSAYQIRNDGTLSDLDDQVHHLMASVAHGDPVLA